MIPPIFYCLRRVDAPRTAYMRGIDVAFVESEFSENSQKSSKRVYVMTETQGADF
jgi:hypothetical protein